MARATITPTSGVGAAGVGARSDADRAREVAATTKIVPFLLSLLAPERRVRDDVRASALIALGKAARGPVALPVLSRWLKDRKASGLVRESAALGMGLMRRDDPDEGHGAAVYDRCRTMLLDVFDDDRAGIRVRAFAAVAIGLLGDQPFGEAFGGDGRSTVRMMWVRLGDRSLHPECTIGLLTALGLHPKEDVPEKVRESLHAGVMGKKVRGRTLDAWERAHALTAVARLGSPGCDTLATRMLDKRSEQIVVRCAALLAMGLRAESMSSDDRAAAIGSLRKLGHNPRDPATTGLGYITLGRLLQADLREQPEPRRCVAHAQDFLLEETKSGSMPRRPYAAIGLALSCRELEVPSRATFVRITEAERLLRAGLKRGDGVVRSAHAIALGLLGRKAAVEDLLALVTDRSEYAPLRGRAAVALGQIGRSSTDVLAAIRLLLADRRLGELRGEAAIALSLLGDSTGVLHLVNQIRPRSTEHLVSQLSLALGRVDSLRAVPPLLEIAADERRTELTQALAVVSLGMLADPAPRSSLLRLTRDANYVARTTVLHEVLTIL
jgi:HEAT repeat protein